MARQVLSYVPQTLDLAVYAGDGPSFTLNVKDPDGNAIPLTGTMKAQIRVTRHAADPPDAEFEVDLTNSATGVAVLKLTGEQTEALYALAAAGKNYIGVWDLEWTPEGFEPVTLCQGKVECSPDVTH
jgi:hypothetical protein